MECASPHGRQCAHLHWVSAEVASICGSIHNETRSFPLHLKKNTTQISNVAESQMFLFYFESMLIEWGKGRCYTDSSPMDGNIYEHSPSPSPSPSWKTYFRQCIWKSGFCQPLLWWEHNRLLWKAQAQLELERMRLVSLQESVRPPLWGRWQLKRARIRPLAAVRVEHKEWCAPDLCLSLVPAPPRRGGQGVGVEGSCFRLKHFRTSSVVLRDPDLDIFLFDGLMFLGSWLE